MSHSNYRTQLESAIWDWRITGRKDLEHCHYKKVLNVWGNTLNSPTHTFYLVYMYGNSTIHFMYTSSYCFTIQSHVNPGTMGSLLNLSFGGGWCRRILYLILVWHTCRISGQPGLQSEILLLQRRRKNLSANKLVFLLLFIV